MGDLENTIKVHIADDHQMIVDGLIAVLDSEDNIEVVGYSSNGAEALEWLKENKTDVLLLDINMPEVSGIDVLKRLKKYKNIPYIIILSSYDDIKLIKDVLKLGANGFVPKKSAGEHIVQAIRSVVEGEQYFTDEVKDKMMLSMMNKPMPNDNPENVFINSLTKREYEILKLISQEYTTKKISEMLFISTSTVESHRKNLIEKMGVKNSVGLVLFAMKNNII